MVAVQIIIAVIPIVGIVMGSVLVFFYFLWRHKQIMLQIKTNTYIRPIVNIRLFCLLLGIMLTVIGCVLFGLFYFIAGLGYAGLRRLQSGIKRQYTSLCRIGGAISKTSLYARFELF